MTMANKEARDGGHSFLIARLFVALFLNLLILAVAVPSLGSISLPNHKIGYGWRDALVVAIILAPLVLILIGIAYSKITEVVGWVLLFALVVLFIISIAIPTHREQARDGGFLRREGRGGRACFSTGSGFASFGPAWPGSEQ